MTVLPVSGHFTERLQERVRDHFDDVEFSPQKALGLVCCRLLTAAPIEVRYQAADDLQVTPGAS